MRVLVIGAGRTGTKVLRQLQKNPRIEVLTADPRPRPHALETGVIDHIDIAEPLTPMNLEHVLAGTEPDLVLLTRSAEDLALGVAPGISLLADALGDELTSVASVPTIQVALA